MKYDNCVLLADADNVCHKQRVPVPISIWRSCGGSCTANAYWWDSGIITLKDGRTAVVLVCYEQFLAWPIARSMLSPKKPDILIISANQWWSRHTSIPAASEQYSLAWAVLFGLTLISATNV